MTNLVKKETFAFSIEDYYIEHQGTAILDIDVTLEFKTPKGQRKSKDYYEFQQIIHYIDSYPRRLSQRNGLLGNPQHQPGHQPDHREDPHGLEHHLQTRQIRC